MALEERREIRRRVGQGARGRGEPRASHATAGDEERCAASDGEKGKGPASTTKPPVMRTMTSTSRAPVPAASEEAATEGRGGAAHSPSAASAAASTPPAAPCRTRLRKKLVLHAAVDDVPGQHGVGGAVAEHEEVGVDARFGHGGAPVAAVALGRLDGRRHAPVAERQQRLVERMPLRLDVEVDVVDAGHQAAHPLDLPLDRARRPPSAATGRRCPASARAGSRCRRCARCARARGRASA